eukprot:1111222-Amphidinium_carterae.1
MLLAETVCSKGSSVSFRGYGLVSVVALGRMPTSSAVLTRLARFGLHLANGIGWARGQQFSIKQVLKGAQS